MHKKNQKPNENGKEEEISESKLQQHEAELKICKEENLKLCR